MATQKNWLIKYVAGNPAMFSRVKTEGAGTIKRSEALAGAAKVAENGWRVWVEHAVTGKRIFESDVESAYKQKMPVMPFTESDMRCWGYTHCKRQGSTVLCSLTFAAARM